MKEDNFRGVSLKYLVEQNPEKLWPTPTASDHKRVDATPEYSLKHAWSLPMAAKFNQPRGGYEGKRREDGGMWPTPTASEDAAGRPDSAMQWMLSHAAESGCRSESEFESIYGPRRRHMRKDITYPTPGTTGLSNGSSNCEKANKLYADGVISEEERRSFRAGNGGKLSPYWTAWLMGWPIEWTDVSTELDGIDYWINDMDNGDWWKGDPADEDVLPRTVEECEQRTAQLKCLGNGQVPLTAALAMLVLSQEPETDEEEDVCSI